MLTSRHDRDVRESGSNAIMASLIGLERSLLGEVAHEHWGGQLGSYIVSGPLQQRTHSRFYKIENPHLPFSLAAKFFLQAERGLPNPRVASEQFNALQKINQRFSHPSYTVIQPVLIRPDHGLLLMEWIEARSLTSYFRYRVPRQQQLAGLQGAGSWLAHFHQSGSLTPGSFDWQHKQKEARLLQSRPLASKVFRRAAGTLVESSGQLETVTVQHCWLHGDFKADNVLIQPRSVVGIDIALRDLNAVEYDLAQFLNQLELLWYAPQRAWRILPGKAAGPELSEVFLRAYQSIQPQVNPFVVAWLRLFLTLSLWQRYRDSSPQSLKQVVLDWLFAKMADQSARELVALRA